MLAHLIPLSYLAHTKRQNYSWCVSYHFDYRTYGIHVRRSHFLKSKAVRYLRHINGKIQMDETREKCALSKKKNEKIPPGITSFWNKKYVLNRQDKNAAVY